MRRDPNTQTEMSLVSRLNCSKLMSAFLPTAGQEVSSKLTGSGVKG